MAEMLQAPDMEALVCNQIRSALAARDKDLPVGTRVPNPRPPEFVRVMRVGGPREALIFDRALLVIETWGNTESAACSLGRLCEGIVFSLAGAVTDDGEVLTVRSSAGLANLPDPESAQDRYTQTVEIVGRVEAI